MARVFSQSESLKWVDRREEKEGLLIVKEVGASGSVVLNGFRLSFGFRNVQNFEVRDEPDWGAVKVEDTCVCPGVCLSFFLQNRSTARTRVAYPVFYPSVYGHVCPDVQTDRLTDIKIDGQVFSLYVYMSVCASFCP